MDAHVCRPSYAIVCITNLYAAVCGTPFRMQRYAAHRMWPYAVVCCMQFGNAYTNACVCMYVSLVCISEISYASRNAVYAAECNMVRNETHYGKKDYLSRSLDRRGRKRGCSHCPHFSRVIPPRLRSHSLHA